MNAIELELVLLLRAVQTDKDIWKLLMDFAHEDAYTVVLDNDETLIMVKTDADLAEPYTRNLTAWIGDSPGVGVLLTTLGIKWERC
jgi:hypothetical protein